MPGTMLCLDVGSSSAIACLMRGGKLVAEAPRAFYPSHCHGAAVEVRAADLLRAVRTAIGGLGPEAARADVLNLAVMSPAWVAMDRTGRPLTPIITHQDRRSVEEARQLEERMGRERHLALCGSRPSPGGISSTTWAWMHRHHPDVLARADLVGHLSTLLHRQWTGARVIDPSNASFTGLYQTTTLGGWSEELCANARVPLHLLPDVVDADRIAGRLTRSAARALGLTPGLPVLTGIMDGSAGMLCAGAEEGRLFNVCGSTDVLALCLAEPRPREGVLTRALGVGRRWLAVTTLAAAASALYWARQQLFAEVPLEEFRVLFARLARAGASATGGVAFDPMMAGDRACIEQRRAAFSGLTLATTREHLLAAIIEGLVQASARRLPLLLSLGTAPLPTVVVSGGSDRLDRILRRDWPGHWRFRAVTDATMKGLARLHPRER